MPSAKALAVKRIGQTLLDPDFDDLPLDGIAHQLADGTILRVFADADYDHDIDNLFMDT